MKKSLIFLSIIFLFAQFQNVGAQKTRPIPKPKTLSAREIAEKVMPSVVLIVTQDENGNPISQGSGYVYRPGLVVSNLHVFERATNAIVKNVKTGEVSKAVEVVGMNAQEDICVIRIDNARFPALSLGDSKSVRTGDEIYVASNPKGLEGSFTKGIVSSVREKNRVKDINDEILRAAGLMTDRTLFQIDAAISPGSSGGVLVNTKAQAIGIIKSSIVSGQNLNFAIPIEQLMAIPLKFKHSIQLAGACAYNDRLKARLNGPVKTLKQILIDQSTGTERIEAYEEFDYFGNNTMSVIYYRSEKKYEIVREFDENGLLTYITYIRPGQKDKAFTSAKEDSIREKINSRNYSGTFEDESGSTRFDQHGNKVRSVLVTDKQSVVTEYKYDDDGRVGFMKELFGDKIWSSRYHYRFDKFGNWIRQDREVLLRSDGEWLDPKISVIREITYHQ